MTGNVEACLTRLVAGHRSGRRLVLLFDYDGTLAPLVEHPSLARLPDETAALLKRFHEIERVAVGVISGRQIDDLIAMIGLSGLYYAGTAGLELDLVGQRITHPDATQARRRIAGLTAQLCQTVANFPGAWVEKKPLGLTVHFRGVPEQARSRLLAQTGAVLRSGNGSVRTCEGQLALEVTAALGWTKGTAVRRILTHVASDALPLYAGDDVNDTEAIQTVQALGGLALGIGPRAPHSVLRLPGPRELASALSWLADHLAS